MAVPVVLGTTASNAPNVDPAVVNLPAGIVAGDLVLVFLAVRGYNSGSSIGTPAGWTKEAADGTPSNSCSGWLWTIATGSMSTLNVDLPNTTNKCAWNTWRISGADAVKVSPAVKAATSAPNPPSFTPAGLQADKLTIAAYSSDGWQGPVTRPTGYTDNPLYHRYAPDGPSAASGTGSTSGATFDPGAFATDGTFDTLAWSVAVGIAAPSDLVIAVPAGVVAVSGAAAQATGVEAGPGVITVAGGAGVAGAIVLAVPSGVIEVEGPTVPVAFSPPHDVCPVAFGTASSLDDVENQVSMARVGGSVITVKDQASIDAYGLRTHRRLDLIAEDDSAVAFAAANRLAEHRTRTRRIEPVAAELDPSDPAAKLVALVDIELGDGQLLAWADGADVPLEAMLHVQGIELNVTPATWRVGVNLWEYLEAPAVGGWDTGQWDSATWDNL